MRRISEMYRRSGGTTPFKTCGECKFFIKAKVCLCSKYDVEILWKESYPACRYFSLKDIREMEKMVVSQISDLAEKNALDKTEKKNTQKKTKTRYKQMNIFDFIDEQGL